jgi:hypothetical protein
MGLYEIVVFVAWLAAIWGIISASIQQSSSFASIGQTKRKWVIINVVGLIIPYLGIVTAAVYGFRVYRRLPTRSKNLGQLFKPERAQSTMEQNAGGYNRPPDFGAPQAGFTPRPAASNQIPCSACGTSGRVGDQACFPCGGKGYV